MADRPYSRVYWTIVDDPKFATIYDDDHHFAAWLRLLLIADQAYPASAHLPASARPASVKALVVAGLVDLSGQRYRIHGLDPERERRSEPGRIGASARWSQSERSPNAMRPHSERNAPINGSAMPDETRRDKTSNTRAKRMTEDDVLRAAQKAAYLELYGPEDQPIIAQPIALPSPAEQEREARRLEALALHERFLEGELSEPQYQRLLADIDKEPDDLTRSGT